MLRYMNKIAVTTVPATPAVPAAAMPVLAAVPQVLPTSPQEDEDKDLRQEADAMNNGLAPLPIPPKALVSKTVTKKAREAPY